MSDDTLHNLSDLMDELERGAIHTTQGSYIKVEDARRLIERRRDALAVQSADAPKPKNLTQAREGAKRFLAEQKLLPVVGPREPGRSVPARE